MKKKLIVRWTKVTAPLILAVLNFLPCVADNAATEPQDRGSEVKALRRRCLNVQAELARTQKELDSARASFLETQKKLKALKTQLAELRVKAANVLVEPDDVNEARTLKQLLADMAELDNVHAKFYQQLLATRQFMESVLKIVGKEADEALKAGLDGRLLLLEKHLQEARKLTRPPEKRAAKAAPRKCRILDVNAKLGAAILDIGRDDGARLGSQWRVSNGRDETLLQIIQVRPSLSAAVVAKGKIGNILAGSQATIWQSAQKQ